MDAIITFATSLLVSILCIPFAKVQARKLTDRLLATIFGENSQPRSFGSQPKVVRARIEHALDVAYSFPSMILTIVAFQMAFDFPQWLQAVLSVTFIALALAFAVYMSPDQFGAVWAKPILGVSLVSWVITLANVAGLVAVIATFHSP